jgi:hypothetical protein
MEDTRKGFLTPEQEKQVDDLVKLQGLAEAMDGPAITLVDNQGFERLKASIIAKYPEALPVVYEVVDAIFDALPKEVV